MAGVFLTARDAWKHDAIVGLGETADDSEKRAWIVAVANAASPGTEPRNLNRCRLSWFTRGLWRIVRLLAFGLPLPPLWHQDRLMGGQS